MPTSSPTSSNSSRIPHTGQLVFGFDAGIASLGFAALDVRDDGSLDVMHMSSHLFATPQNPKTKESLTAGRRGYRSDRRRRARLNARKRDCRALLIRFGLMPKGADAAWFETRKGDEQIIVLRSRALNERLGDREIARLMYYFVKHRQYINQGKGALDADAIVENGRVLAALAENKKIMESTDARTYGEYLMSLHAKGERTRNRAGEYSFTIPHEMVRDEATFIIEAQRAMGAVYLTPEFESEYLSILSRLRSTYERDERTYSKVGACTYLPGHVRAARATLSSEAVAAAEALAHVRVVTADGTTALPASVRVALLRRLFDPMSAPGQGRLKYSDVRRALRAHDTSLMGADDVFRGVARDKESSKVLCSAKGFNALRAALSGHVDTLLHLMDESDLIDDVIEALVFASSRDSYECRLEELGVIDRLIDEDAAIVRGLPYGAAVFNGYGARSRDALSMLLPALVDDDIASLRAAEDAVGLTAVRAGSRVPRGSLLPPYEVFDPTCENSVVLRAAARFRATFNEAVHIYGVPDVVRIELARDLKNSRREKRQAEAGMRENERANEAARARAAALLGKDVDAIGGREIVCVRFWDEQGGIDPYTGDEIDLLRALRDATYTEIDHILPISRSCDDSKVNKVLVCTASNRDKGARTPFEWLAASDADSPAWVAYCERVRSMKSLRPAKAHRLMSEDFKDASGDFVAKNLVDTQYMSRSFKEWVETSIAFPDDGRTHVFAVSGRATSMLRRGWGLNAHGGTVKDRSDDRHHAVDAAVIAACTPSLVQMLAAYGERVRNNRASDVDTRIAERMPAADFADAVRSFAARIRPTRSVSHRVVGRATEDSMYSVVGEKAKGRGRLLLLSKSGSVRPSSTAIPVGCGYKKLGRMAYINLWFEPAAKKGGKWVIEPVYCADIPALQRGDYVARYCDARAGARDQWPVVSDAARERGCVQVFSGDMVVVDGHMARYNKMCVSTGSIVWADADEGFPSIGKWGADSVVRVMDEDPLGLCFLEPEDDAN